MSESVSVYEGMKVDFGRRTLKLAEHDPEAPQSSKLESSKNVDFGFRLLKSRFRFMNT